MSQTYTIRELADAFDVTTRTIRFYEDEGLLSPLRDGQNRIFRSRDRVRLKLILRGKRLGFTLAEIKEIVGMYDAPPGESGQLTLFIEKLRERRAELEDKRRDIDETLAELDALEEQSVARLKELTAK
ncbi:MerR family DNA-binding transcriptional regulator [Hwanghaeella grinnelliae]|uniref:MerR family DNA-binding transcriptional regulator n=1 Tax=Hwanghaeella grinnelliae TaxID=2500179 RepID=A0A437QW17_9PROT|nr:MerR family DNA-binding transcriptional regulator [Hwanghaeella grinnelliae]RVU38725.1 MerR family DNA-binding transcriptional regulator [Hwanghaeella grinnelliae]